MLHGKSRIETAEPIWDTEYIRDLRWTHLCAFRGVMASTGRFGFMMLIREHARFSRGRDGMLRSLGVVCPTEG